MTATRATIGIAIFSGLLTSASYAQEGARTHSESQGALEARPDRVESINASVLKRRGVTDLAQAMQWLSAGASVNPTNTSSGLLVDGLGSSQLIVLRDGVQIARQDGSPQGPIVDLSSVGIDPELVERIDIYRGIGPSGSAGASGVVIDIITRRPRSAHHLSALGQWISSAQAPLTRQSYQLSGHSSLTSGLAARLAVQWDQLDALDLNEDQAPDSPSRQRLSLEAGLSMRPSRNELIELSYLQSGLQTRSFGGVNAPLDDQIQGRRHELRLQGKWWLGQDVRLQHNTSARYERHDFSKLVRASGFERPKAQTTQSSALQSLTFAWFLPSHELGLDVAVDGLQVERQGETGELPTAWLGAVSAGLSDKWELGRRAQVSAQLLAEQHSSFGAAAQAQLSAITRLAFGLSLRGGLSSTRRRPTPEELFLSFDHGEVGYRVIGEPGLKPERLNSGRLGLIWRTPDQRAGVELEGFYHRVHDAIQTVSAGSPGLFTYTNVGQVRAAGLNVSAQAERLPGQLGLKLSYNALPLAQDLEAQQRQPLRPQHAVNMMLWRQWLDGELEAWVDLQARSAMSVPDGSPPAPAQAILGLGARWTLSSYAQLMLDMNNLLDERHPTWGPSPGLNVMASVKLNVLE